MYVRKEIYEALQTLGLNEHEVNTYIALVAGGSLTASEISDATEIVRPRVYGILEDLEKKGLVNIQHSRPMRFRAVSPEEAIKNLRSIIEREYACKMSELKKIEENMLYELKGLFNKSLELTRPEDIFWTLTGRKNIYHKLDESIRNSKERIILISRGDGINRCVKYLYDPLEQARKNGVLIKNIVPIKKENLNDIMKLSKIMEIRHIDNVYAKFWVFDDKDVMIFTDIESKPGFDIGVWTKHKNVAAMFDFFFDCAWRGSKSLEERVAELK
ncbi:MAG: TrmB family transcriptional regulator [Candidatus Hydrothermarchaeota archaeon]